MTEFAEELKSLRYGLRGAAPDDDFVARVMESCSSARPPATARAPAGRKPWRLAGALAAAACLALGVSVWQLPEDPSTEARGTVAARGATGERLRVTVEAFVGHAAAGTAPPLLEGAVLRPGDGILVRYSNLASERAYLMVFALDERDSVHWIHPAYLSENANPTSLKLAQQATHRILPEVAEPEDAAPGRLRVYALLSRTELDVRGVEGRLAGTKQGVAELFPEAEVEEWRCTWSP